MPEFEQFEPFEQLAQDDTPQSQTRSGPSLKARAVDFLSRREHSRLELRRKLQRHSDDINEIDALLDELAQDNWQSDERYAQSLIYRRASKYGSARVVQELRQNGVADEHIEAVREQLKETEYERAVDVWERKFGTVPADRKAYAKQHRFMASRGFSPGLLGRILNEIDELFP